jgi:hypothetical protein
MLRYSYKVELRRYEARKLGLELDLARSPDNQRAKEMLEITNKEINWFKEMIASGKDPGCITL